MACRTARIEHDGRERNEQGIDAYEVGEEDRAADPLARPCSAPHDRVGPSTLATIERMVAGAMATSIVFASHSG